MRNVVRNMPKTLNLHLSCFVCHKCGKLGNMASECHKVDPGRICYVYAETNHICSECPKVITGIQKGVVQGDQGVP